MFDDARRSSADPDARAPKRSGDGGVRGSAGIAVPSTTLPKGGGAIRGIGEKFAANPVTGTASLTVPLATSPGRAGFGPDLALTYDSGAGNGAFGIGWVLSTPAISRKTELGLPRYRDAEESDVFLLSGSEDLVPVLAPDGSRFEDRASAAGYTIHRYRPRIEGSFARIERWTHAASGAIHWRSISPQNVTTLYGTDTSSRVSDPDDERRVFSWLACQSYDDKGNAIVFDYAPEDDAGVGMSQLSEWNRLRTANRYLKRVRYGNRVSHLVQPDLRRAEWLFELVFDYGEGHYVDLPLEDAQPRFAQASAAPAHAWETRPDPFSSYRSGFEVRTHRRCRRVLLFHRFEELGPEPCLVRATELDYADLDYTQSRTVEEELGHAGSTRVASFLRSVTQSGYVRDASPVVNRDGVTYVSYRKQSLPPLELDYSRAVIQDEVRALDAESARNLPCGVDGAAYQWVDLEGEGLSGILAQQAGTWFYKPNLGDGRFGAQRVVESLPSVADLGDGNQALLDLAADGRLELVALAGPMPGFFERTTEGGWSGFRSFERLPNLDWDDPQLRFVDLDGDGRADVLLCDDEVFTWYPSLGEEGFASARQLPWALDEDSGPRLVVADRSQSVFLADMSGDGLADLVRIRNGDVCYWPNRGFGRFGAKVAMDNAPWFDKPDEFDERRLRLADVDGSGVTDILYLGRGGVRVYFNQSGNRWSEPRRLPRFPSLDNTTSVAAADLLGNGTACLVWSSTLACDAERPLRYIDLMGGRKPHLLIRSANNLGAETHIRYAPSTKFYLDDQRDGTPWITRLPFPVHVVERVETRDLVSRNRFVTEYAYHHGYFDPVEREFRGFGMVEQRDTEAFEDYVHGVRALGGDQTQAPELFQPPVTTRTWYHTGALFEQRALLDEIRTAFQPMDVGVADPLFPADLDADEQRECARALKGLPICSAVFSFDGSPQQQHPYSVVSSRFEVRRLQARGGQRHAVVDVIARESIAHESERNPADPRVAHTLLLEVDAYGNPKKSCSVVYGRVAADASLPDEVTREQLRPRITYTEVEYTDDVDRTSPARVYRLRMPFASLAYEITGVAPRSAVFEREEIRAAIAGATPIDYEVVADDVTRQKRLLSRVCHLFLADDLRPLPLGQWDSLGLAHQSYQLALGASVIATHYAGEVTDAELTAAGYRHFDGDADWWIPSGTSIYPANPKDHFYQPIGTRDPFGIETVATPDRYDLLIQQVEVRQAAWNRVRAENDYRVLGPVQMTDPNQNRSAVEIDALGMVVKAAVMGKLGANEGDTLADPTVRMEYDVFRWMRERKPCFVRTLAREKHGAANLRWQESYAYSNGTGGVALTKLQAHPGKAVAIDAAGNAAEVDASPRWIGNGRTILDNKGNPVKQYEPYFSTTHEFEDEKALREIGVTPVLFYDPLGRNVRTLFPSGTLARVEIGGWKVESFDPNDTVLESTWFADRGSPNPAAQPEPQNDAERRAAWLAAKHAGTSSVAHFDNLGRAIYAVSDYGGGRRAAVRTERDLTGRTVKVFDEAQREVASGFVAMSGAPITGESAEKGRRWTFQNIAGGLVKSWDARDRRLRAQYDALQRPLAMFVREAGQPEILFNYVVYGDRLADAQQRNLLGTAHQIFDQAGTVRVAAADFEGNPIRVERILAREYERSVAWDALLGAPDLGALQAAAAPALEVGEVFVASAEYDALGRPTRATLPDGTVITPAYDEANHLASLRAQIRGRGNAIEFLEGQEYNAKGQRQLARHGNGVTLRFFHDPKTFRLTRLLAHRDADDPATRALQDLTYTYDPVGNVTQIRDDAQQTHYFANQVVKPESRFEYDALYQLTRATGREHAGQANDGTRGHADVELVPQLPHANDAAAVRNYSEEYEYDLLGNITLMHHRFKTHAGVGGGWTRRYRYAYQDDPADRTNRLASTSLPGDPDAGPYTATYAYDAYGGMTRMPHLARLDWNFMDQLSAVDLGGGGNAWYVYGLGGERIRKVIERNGATKLEWIFLGPLMIFRRRRRDTNALRLERWTVHIGDGSGPIAQIDTKTRDDDGSDPANPLDTPVVRYSYSNHLGSAQLETDESGTILSYEEYHPFGTSAYRSARPGSNVSLKRFRFSGKERDDETGLYYFGARYYAPWLGRWTSADPGGFIAGLNLFRYCSNSPIVFHDPNGMDEQRTVYSTKDLGLSKIRDPKEFSKALRDLGADFTGFGANGQPAPAVDGKGVGLARPGPNGKWDVGRWLKELPREGSGGASQAPQPQTAPTPGGDTTAPPTLLPPRALGPRVEPPPLSTDPIPKLDITQAEPGTNFARAEGSARQEYRGTHGLTGRGTAVQHPQKWREGQRTNTHPRITNDPEFLHPISNQRGTGGSVDGRNFATEHTLADRGLYPKEAAATQKRWGWLATERLTTLWAGKRVREQITGSRGPSFLREYIVAPMLRGATGHVALAATRELVPFVVEAELGLMGAGLYLYSAGFASAGVAVFGAASAVPVAGTGLAAGVIIGNAAEELAREWGASKGGAHAAGALAAAGSGAAFGALVGSVIPGVGTGVGVVVGGIAGLIGYGVSKWL